ncbi:YdcH family protein [Aliagarivorans marinus]|uniref:YdcH family protein n=1 Tax=Aliagarivorans marinus TaxID=561965 RepID=UPI000418D224|nr:YdcH family protein [Aliagarivorans marinus]
MLGEVHSLSNDFPELQDVITSLMESDEEFAKENKRYTALDKEIRTLELNNGPIGDEDMHQLKHDRAVLKDALYQRLLNAKA